MAYIIKLKPEETKLIWNYVREIVETNYDEINKKAKSLRESFYIVRDYLSEDYLKVGKITEQMFNFFATENDAYNYYTQEIWTGLERKGYIRPDAKPIGIMYWKQRTHTIDNLNKLLPQCRGFIYVEKEGIAESLKELSDYGWCIVASQGQSTRQIRQLLKNTGKKCLTVHDYDPDGEIIANSIQNTTRRTSHLNIALKENAVDLILNDEQQDYLIKSHNIPTQPLPNKHKGKWKKDYRVELSAFVVINVPSGDAVLDFVKAEMKRLGFPLSLEPVDKSDLFESEISYKISDKIEKFINERLKQYKIKGKSCQVELKKEIKFDKGKEEQIKDALNKILTDKFLDNIKKNCKWTSEEAMEKECLKDTPTRWINRIIK